MRLLRSIAVLVALLLLGCGSVSSGGSYPILAYPALPKAVSEPGKVWLRCGSYGGHPDSIEAPMYCVEEIYGEDLKKYIQKLDSIYWKYTYALEEINKSN